MPCSEKVIWTLIHPRKACYPALCPKCVETVESAGKDLICVRLMADVKNDLVPFRVEGSQQGDCKFNCSQGGCKVTAVFQCHLKYHFPDLTAQLIQFAVCQALKAFEILYRSKYAHGYLSKYLF